MPTGPSVPQSSGCVNPQPLTPATRAELRDELLRLRFQLLTPLPSDAYWRIHDRAEELATLLAGPVREIDSRCEAATPPVYATFESRPALKGAVTRPSKDAL